ncbi:MAG: magnesium transporter CorA family protein [Patescibacteria group bacterium]|nr:magnesium transporter CorA family protein [Patescibacteria group bacterium]
MRMNIIRTKNLTWIDIKDPAKEDLQSLKQNYDLHPLVLKEILPRLDYPKMENFSDYLFLVIFYPFFDKETSSTVPFELDIIVGKDFIITNHYRDIMPLSALFHKCNLYPEQMQELCAEGPGGLLYRIVNEIMLACFPKLSHIKQNIDEIEKIIFKKQNKTAVSQISLVKRDLIGFERIIEPQKLVLQNLVQECKTFFPSHLLPYFHNLNNTYEQVRSILETNKNTLSAMETTSQSLIDTHTNEIMKALTVFLVLMYPFSLVADIFSMNGQFLQWTASPQDFWKVYGLMFMGFVTILIVFKKKKWL